MEQRAIRDAATVILVRDPETDPRVLMGQRGESAAFMPNKFVFPGGAVDSGDESVPFANELPEPCAMRLDLDCTSRLAPSLFAAAIRELWEETGLMVGANGDWPGEVPEEWRAFADLGLLPDPDRLSFVFRAITPPGRPRRFDARFFLGNASEVKGDPDDFSGASDELRHLQWIPLGELRQFEMPFITEVVLAEISSSLPNLGSPESVPFFRSDDEQSRFLRLGGGSTSAAARKCD